jgi:prepilin-type N-terminal cleavage/methylation domain-containing protein/prepilin-type processing-associated H-X9-DG protein
MEVSLIKLRKGFTLIELLVVIAIIAILAAILFPVFAQAKAAAKKTASLSNQKQITTATMMYAGDYDDGCVLTFYPGVNVINMAPGCTRPGRFDTSPVQPCDATGQTPGWPKLIQPYAKNFDLLRDPTVGDPWGIYSNPSYNWWYNFSRFSNYGYNWVYLCPTKVGAVDGAQAPVTMTTMQDPANTVLYTDSRINLGSATTPSWRSGYIVIDPPYRTNSGAVYSFTPTGQVWTVVSPDPRYNEGFNVSWSDGHAKFSKPGNVVNDGFWDLL